MKKITEREEHILRLLKNDPMIAQEDLAGMLGISRSAAAVHISNLIKKGFILGRGYVFNDRSGVLVLGPVFVQTMAEAGVYPEGSADVEIVLGGAGYLIASYLANQNVPVALISAVGRDDWGERMGDNLKKKGVDTRYLLIQQEYPTPRQVILREEGKLSKIISDSRAVGLLSRESLQGLGVTIENCRMLVVDTGIPHDLVKYVTETALKAGVQVCLNFEELNSEDLTADNFKGVYLAVMDKNVAERLSETRIVDLDDAVKAGKKIISLGVNIATVIVPGQGVALVCNEETVTVPLMPSHDRTGEISGSVLASGLVSGILHGHDYRQAVRLGLGMAAHWAGKTRNLSKRKEKQ